MAAAPIVAALLAAALMVAAQSLPLPIAAWVNRRCHGGGRHDIRVL